MNEILVACGNVNLLKQIILDLPPNMFKPIATKRGAGIAQQLDGRDVQLAVIHEHLEDDATGQLLVELERLDPAPKVLLLSTDVPPSQGPFDRALRYPVPGPVFRNALHQLMPVEDNTKDLEKWRVFYQELKTKNEHAGEENYYQVLGVPDGAPHHLLVRAFDKISLRYHPDRFNQYRSERWGAAICDEVDTLYKVQMEAYSVLTDRQLRARYEKALERGEVRLSKEETAARPTGPKALTDIATNSQSKKFLKLAQTNISTQNWSGAMQNLKFALSMDANNEDIQAKIAEIEAKLGG
ncbi:MAG: DnaJ domain-containing protein [Myxococcota bacterium]